MGRQAERYHLCGRGTVSLAVAREERDYQQPGRRRTGEEDDGRAWPVYEPAVQYWRGHPAFRVGPARWWLVPDTAAEAMAIDWCPFRGVGLEE